MDRVLITRPFQMVLTWLPIITAGLYLLGSNFQSGYLEGFGIDASLFPMAFDGIISNGFYALLVLSVEPVANLMYVVIVLVGACICSMMMLDAFKPIRVITEKVSIALIDWFEHQTNLDIPPILERTFKWLSQFLVYAALALTVILLTATAGEQARKSGIGFASQFKESADKHEKITLGLKLKSGDSLEAVSLTCSTIHCAYLVDGKAIVLRHEDVERITVIGKTVAAKEPAASLPEDSKSSPPEDAPAPNEHTSSSS